MTDHGHCPRECDHPQPFEIRDGIRVCGACWFTEGMESVMVPCTPTTCPDLPWPAEALP